MEVAMHPEEEEVVLIGVINRKRDLERAINEHWYRVPRAKMEHYLEPAYIAFYLSRAFKERNGGIYYYAKIKGHELVRRRDLLPEQPDHPRADHVYYRLALGPVEEKSPPILNPSGRPISFIYTSWARFESARTIGDLKPAPDEYIERIVQQLQAMGIPVTAVMEDDGTGARVAELRIQCQQSILRITREWLNNFGAAADSGSANELLADTIAHIQNEINNLGGLQMLDVPPAL
jgi:hypothetical protein